MSNEVKNIDIKNQTYYFFNHIINIKNFDSNKNKIDEKSYKNILIYYIRYVTIKDLKYVKINSVNPLYLIFSNVNVYFEEINGNKYSKLLSTNESKEKIKKYEGICSKIRDLIRSITNNSDIMMIIKFNSDDNLPINKTIEISTMAIVFRVAFREKNKYYPQVF